MSTQHPDNVLMPFFARSSVIEGEDEIKEAFYAFSHLHCEEQMWDCEGKEIDEFVIKKLLVDYSYYFRENVIGRNVFITLRVPNPTVERDEAKILLETLESIPRSYDSAKLFYEDGTAPIFEVILPMVTGAVCLNRVYYYYRDFVAGKEEQLFFPGDVSIKEWIGEFQPKSISVIPLIEDRDSLLKSHQIVEEYLRDKDLPYLRVFLARSDPALNYSSLATTLTLKVALQRLHRLESNLGLPLYPILGVGSVPFRGNFKPTNYLKAMGEYPSVQTYTIQSAFKYDYPNEVVTQAILDINSQPRGAPTPIDEDVALRIIEKVSKAYEQQLLPIAGLVNRVARYVPARRARKLHVGLFGYARQLAGVQLPRAISFCAALYSIGLPPELLGIDVLDEEDLTFIRAAFPSFEDELSDAASHFDANVFKLLPEEYRARIEKSLSFAVVEPDEAHREATSRVISALIHQKESGIQDLIMGAAALRRFLG
ncbi:MAG: phosphoenolpyruvate carboxylase [Dehalococcoidia bacterium]|nr:phosphoenolpyruvate carboxylase [Dehalococcoidia bacterium]